MIKKVLGLIMAAMVVIFVAIAVYFALNIVTNPAMKPVLSGDKVEPVVTKTTTLRLENQYTVCGDVEVYYRGPAPEELIGLDEKRLKMKYPRQDGWTVSVHNDEVVITRQIDGLCGMHNEYRHLGIHDGCLAVYQGPLGYDDLLLRLETNIDLTLLPESFLEKLNKAEAYNLLSPDEKFDLQHTLEFEDEHALNALLENFDEYGN